MGGDGAQQQAEAGGWRPNVSLREVLNSDGPWTIEIVDTMDNERQDTGGCIE